MPWTPRRVLMTLAPSGLAAVLAACGPGEPGGAGADPAYRPSAQDLCASAAARWGGNVAAAFDATVQDVRAHMADPHRGAEDPSVPRPAAYAYPAGWHAKDPADPAAVCYLDGPIPKAPPPTADGTPRPPFDRRLVIAAPDAESFMVSAGYRHALPTKPLPRLAD